MGSPPRPPCCGVFTKWNGGIYGFDSSATQTKLVPYLRQGIQRDYTIWHELEKLKIASDGPSSTEICTICYANEAACFCKLAKIEREVGAISKQRFKLLSCFILAMTQTNSGLANSDALRMAGIATPGGSLCSRYHHSPIRSCHILDF